MNLYFISGLGADERMFQRLTLPGGIRMHHIAWPGLSPRETMDSYLDKLMAHIDATQPFGIVGLSFGGILATEIAKKLQPQVTILLSTVSTSKEMPLIYRLSGKLGLNKLVPGALLIKVYPFTNHLFGVNTPADKLLLRSVIEATSAKFASWAVNEIVNWKNDVRPGSVFHIHGGKDRLFPVKLTRADIVVKDAGHLMVHTHAGTVSRIIAERLGAGN